MMFPLPLNLRRFLTLTLTLLTFQCAAVEPQVKGFDISHFQGTVNWPVIAKQPFTFAIAKATGGETYVDPTFHTNWHGMRTIGITRGAYHFFYAADDAKAQAEHYLKTIGQLKPTDLPPILDVEISDHVKPKALLNGVLTWLEIVAKATGRTPIVYTDPAFGKAYLTDPRLSRYSLWIADYQDKVPPLPKPWKKSGWTLWQYSQTGKISGVEGAIDLDKFNGNLAQFKQFVKDSNR